MSIIDKKKQIFGNVAAAKTLTEGLPKLKLSSSFPSISNGGNSISFLTDLIKSLIGYEELVNTLVNTLNHSLTDIEADIKKTLKKSLVNIVSCGVNPTIPTFIKSTGDGIVIEVNKIDFFDLFKMDPNSKSGDLIYTDITPTLTDSTDFNTFMFGVLQDDGVTHTWQNIYDITFNSVGDVTRPNNTLTIKTSPNYDTKKLTDLNNNFIDSLTLFNSANILNRVIDIMFGSISVSVGKSTKQLEGEARINNIIDCMVDSDLDDEIDDSYFTFSNEEVYRHEQEANLRKLGVVKLDCCNKIPASIPLSFLTNFNDEMKITSDLIERKNVIVNNLDKMAQQNTINSNNASDDVTIKLNFIQEIIQNLVKSIVWSVISPKVIFVFLLNYKIVYGTSATFDDPIDFIKKNKNLFTGIIKEISSVIITLLTSIVLKEISKLVAASTAKKLIERGKNTKAQLLSLVGVPQEILRKIKGLV